ncbi:MAG: FHA domain-containing protein, partial [Victivallaceae bacterium]
MKIFFVNGVRAGEELDLALPIISVGREEDNAVMLLTGGVSRYHGELRRDESGVWTVVDLQSTNGVKVNRAKIDGKAVLSEGDLIEFGDQMLRVTQLAKSPPKVVFSPVGAAAAEPAPHLNKSADPTVRLTAPPIPAAPV